MSDEEYTVNSLHIGAGIVGLIVAGIFYIGIPLFFNKYFIPNFDEIIHNPEISVVWTNIIPLFDRWLLIGIPMTFLGALTWACPKGSRHRFTMSSVYLIAYIAWLLYVLNFGDLTGLVDITYQGGTIAFGMTLSFILYLIVLFKALKLLVIYGTYKDERRNYLNGE